MSERDSLFDFRVLASVALVDGLAAPIVAFETPYFIAGSVMLVSSFGLIALGMVWSK